MRKQLLIPAVLAVFSIAIVAFFALSNFTSASAQQILERASAAQSAAESLQGIRHTRIETYQNFQVLGEDQPPSRTTVDSFFDQTTGQYRIVTQDGTGNITQISASDASFTYSTKEAGSGRLMVYRTPHTPDEEEKIQPVVAAAATYPSAATKSAFDQFNNNPRVLVVGEETRADGKQVFVLVNQNYRTQKMSNGQEGKSYTGSMQMVFDAHSYQWLESQSTILKDGKEVIIEATRTLVDEVLPEGTPVAWDLGDLKNVTLVDVARVEESEASFETLSVQELASRTDDGYVLRPLPEGFTEEIVAAANQPKDEIYHYEVNYSNPAGEYFDLMFVDVLSEGFVETSFYDGSYKTAAGLVLHYSMAGSDPQRESTSAILTLLDGNSFLLNSSMTREQVQTLVEDLTHVQ